MGAEAAGFHPRRDAFAGTFEQSVEQRVQLRRAAAAVLKPGRMPDAGVGGQGELADQQQAAAGSASERFMRPSASAKTR